MKVVTNDGTVHEFRVTGIDPDTGTVSGKDDKVDIQDIVALEKRELSKIKTGLLVGGLVLGLLGTDCEGPDCDEFGGIGFSCC